MTCVHIHQWGKHSSYLENHLRHQGNIIRGMRENIFLERIIPIKAYPSHHSLVLSLFTKAKFNKLKDLKIWVTEVLVILIWLVVYKAWQCPTEIAFKGWAIWMTLSLH